MRITYDEAKRALTFERRDLDFALAGLVFGDRHMTRIDEANGREKAFFEASLARP